MTLRAANTHVVGYAGLLGTAAALLVHLGAQMVAGHHWAPPDIVQLALADIDPLTLPLIAPGVVAAYLGRPSTVQADAPQPPQTAAVIVSGTAGGSSPHMSIFQEFESGALAALATASTQNEALVKSWLTSGEASVQAGFVNLLKNVPSVKGLSAVFVGPLEAAAEAALSSYVASLFTKYNPDELFTLWMALLALLEKDVAA